MEQQTLQQRLQNKASAMVACLELIKLDIKSVSEEGRMAQGKRKLQMWKHYAWKTIRISVNAALWIFIIYKILQ